MYQAQVFMEYKYIQDVVVILNWICWLHSAEKQLGYKLSTEADRFQLNLRDSPVSQITKWYTVMPEDKFAKIFEGKYSEHIQYIPIFWKSQFQNIQVFEILEPKVRPERGGGSPMLCAKILLFINFHSILPFLFNLQIRISVVD